jgi:hypothetical protein
MPLMQEVMCNDGRTKLYLYGGIEEYVFVQQQQQLG